MTHSYKTPEENVAMGIIDIDVEGKNDGTNYWCTTTFHFKITDKREDVLARVMRGFDIVRKNIK
jgi:hypothetical protein